jgi:hypothetical protein
MSIPNSGASGGIGIETVRLFLGWFCLDSDQKSSEEPAINQKF